ncbi:MAG TPA: WhiB family transcriptional regulator [Candidatus Saccharimonadales bacterium]|nr:WhiB family transcriptional regulator [Candidatus Saccharimonadales bacterium]
MAEVLTGTQQASTQEGAKKPQKETKAQKFARHLAQFGGRELQDVSEGRHIRGKCMPFLEEFDKDSFGVVRERVVHNAAELAVCGTCPFQNPCLAMAIREESKSGVYGGLTAKQRSQVTGLIRKGDIDEAWEVTIESRTTNYDTARSALNKIGSKMVAELAWQNALAAGEQPKGSAVDLKYYESVTPPTWDEKVRRLAIEEAPESRELAS